MTSSITDRKLWQELFEGYWAIRSEWEAAYAAGHEALRRYWEAHGCVRCIHETKQWWWNKGKIERVKKAIEQFRTPAGRRSDRFYCQRHTQPLDAGVAVDAAFALGLAGHVGFAFCIPDVTWRSYSELLPMGANWVTASFAASSIIPGLAGVLARETRFDPIKRFRDDKYTGWKRLQAKDGNFEEALLRCLSWEKSAYAIILQNCLDATDDVLTGFGVEGLPLRHLHTPLSYYTQILVSKEIPLNAQPEEKAESPKKTDAPNRGNITFVRKLAKLHREFDAVGAQVKLAGFRIDRSQSIEAQSESMAQELVTRLSPEQRTTLLKLLQEWANQVKFMADVSGKKSKSVVVIDEQGFPTLH